MNISIRHLRAFRALVTERSFTRAAARVHLSQPAFSALIGQFEASLGIRLFDRSTRSVELTAEGESFDVSARRILAEVESALEALGDRVARRRGRVSIALLPSLAADWLPHVLVDFHERHPGVELEVADVLSDACIHAVQRGSADFALASTRADTPELKATRLCHDGFNLVCPSGHPLTRLARVRPDDLRPYPFIHLGRTSSVRQYIDAATYPMPLRALLEVDQLATVAGMVRAGLGVSIIPELALYQFSGPGLALRPLDWPGLKRDVYLIQRRDRSLSIAAEELCAFIFAHPPMIKAAVKRRSTKPRIA